MQACASLLSHSGESELLCSDAACPPPRIFISLKINRTSVDKDPLFSSVAHWQQNWLIIFTPDQGQTVLTCAVSLQIIPNIWMKLLWVPEESGLLYQDKLLWQCQSQELMRNLKKIN